MRTVKAGATYAAIGCGAQLGFMFAAGNLSESIRDSIGDVYYFGGCAQMFFSGANDTATLALDVFGLASCADGFIQMVADMNAVNANRANPTVAQAFDEKVNYDFINTETGCLISLASLLTE